MQDSTTNPPKHPSSNRSPPNPNQTPQNDATLRASFTITYILLLTTATITFIEAIRTQNPTVRHVLNLETCISVVAGYFYSAFKDKIETSNATTIDWKDITKTRYIDWSITTPMMLLALCIVLSNEIRLPVHLPVIAAIIVLNYTMLYAGYLGETQQIDRRTANIAGFAPFLAMFGIIYWNYVRPKYDLANRVMFFIYLIIWSMYGIVYMLDEYTKNIAMNVLDLIAKCIVGLGLWVYYVHIVVL
jgi:bacteriorhodopsin